MAALGDGCGDVVDFSGGLGMFFGVGVSFGGELLVAVLLLALLGLG